MISFEMISQIPRARPHLDGEKLPKAQWNIPLRAVISAEEREVSEISRADCVGRKQTYLLFPWCIYFLI